MSEPLAQPDMTPLQGFLRDRDVACPRCQYNLRNLTGDRCPECGEELVLRVNLAEPKMAAYFTGLIGLAAGAGFNGLLLIFLIAMSILHGGGGGGSNVRSVLIGGTIVMALSLWIYLQGRLYLRKQPIRQQWIAAFSAWALSIASLIVFTKLVR